MNLNASFWFGKALPGVCTGCVVCNVLTTQSYLVQCFCLLSKNFYRSTNENGSVANSEEEITHNVLTTYCNQKNASVLKNAQKHYKESGTKSSVFSRFCFC